MGTLSGGGKQVISIGKRCLLGANAGIGISLGDDCVVAAGTYVTAGTKVTLPDGSVVKARELSGQSGWLYWHNSVNGRVEATPRQGEGIALNEALALQRLTVARRRTTAILAVLGRDRCRRRGLFRVARGRRPAARPRELHGHRRRPHRRDVDRAGRERRPDRRRRRAARTAGPGRHHRDRDGVPGVEAAEPRRRRPRLARHLPAAAEPGLGHREADHGPVLLDQRLLRRAGEGRRLPGHGDHRRRAGGAALGLPRRVRRPRAGRPRDRQRDVGQQQGSVHLRRRRARRRTSSR